MELILDLLRRLPDYPRLRTALESAQAVGVSGAAQINRSHLIAALCRDTARPAVVVCQDEMAARRTQSELAAFLGAEAPILPTRDLMFYDASAISRGWEQQRLRCLYDLARGKTPLLLTTLEAFSLRTMPRAQLFSAAMRLLPGAQLELDELISRLVHAGYSRCSLVEGAGQFSVRGWNSSATRSTPWAILTPSRSGASKMPMSSSSCPCRDAACPAPRRHRGAGAGAGRPAGPPAPPQNAERGSDAHAAG